MSNPIAYDSLLVHHLARELHETLVRQRLRGLVLNASARRLVLELDDFALAWELHPTRGWLRRLEQPPVRDPEAAEASGRVHLPRQARVAGVEPVPDDRVLCLLFTGAGKDRTRRLTVELMTNQWNAVAQDGAGRIAAVLWTRETGERRLVPGAEYEVPAPPGGARAGRDHALTEAEWLELLDVPPEERKRALVRSIAWTSPLNAPAILGAAAEAPGRAPLLDAFRRYAALAPPHGADAAAPCVLELDRGPTAYPVPLPGIPAEPAEDLLTAMATAAEAEAPTVITPEALDRLRDHARSLEHRLRGLRRELSTAPSDAERFRSQGDLLLARLHEVPHGEQKVELEDFDGDTVELSLDPAKSPAENAELLYERAAKRERAAEKLPAVVERTESELERATRLLEDAEDGSADPDALRALLGELEADRDKGPGSRQKALPYRTYRTSGGLEVRVGRGRKANDDLTFHHSSPDDIWLHARDVAAAHVVLRWPNRDQNPPRRDLHEAATLAAWHSKARTSGTVPVDWTRRKYVRKPRKAPPGLVTLDRVETVFVEPSEELERRLRA